MKETHPQFDNLDDSKRDIESLMPRDSPMGVIIGGRFEIGSLLQRENHADVYSILPLVAEERDHEARVYDLEVDSKKLRQYRLRNLKRLYGRKVLEVQWQRLLVVVYTKDIQPHGDSEPMKRQAVFDLSTSSTSEAVDVRERTRKPNHKTEHRREAARINQLEKRRADRTKTCLADASNSATADSRGKNLTTVASEQEVNDQDAMIVLLHLAYNDRPELLQELPPVSRTIVERYLQHKSLEFNNDEEMEIFMKVKQKEVIFLGHQEKKIVSVIQQRHDEFGQLLRDQMKLRKASREWNEMQEGPIATARHRLKMARHVQDLLPKLVSDADSVFRELRKRCASIKKKREEIDTISALITRRELLERRIAAEEKSSQGVVPASATYNDIVSRAHASIAELELLVREVPPLGALNMVTEKVRLLEEDCRLLRVVRSVFRRLGSRNVGSHIHKCKECVA
ncbi:hypothetical protein DL95DRAFT_466304 [Leptodontidium sp. 2 PMI_412]|nr:hypothetical protein DL95DRAFT_466304 [Leptodontidium sp. 2 PMI_412]